jgi:hypothetical protein
MYSRHTLFGICLRYRNILGFLKIGEQPEPPQKNRTAAKKSQALTAAASSSRNSRNYMCISFRQVRPNVSVRKGF